MMIVDVGGGGQETKAHCASNTGHTVTYVIALRSTGQGVDVLRPILAIMYKVRYTGVTYRLKL